jgi:penicillin-binding protein 1A
MKLNKIIVSISIVLLLFIPYIFIVLVYTMHYDAISTKLEYNPNLPTVLFDSEGSVITTLYDEMRIPVEFDKIPQTVLDAFTTAEDKNFFSHNGIDYFGILRAFVINVKAGSIKQGGSTITQQLIKQLYTSQSRTIERKIIELLLVSKIEREYSKNKILEMYLNHIYFGHGVYGVNAAASFFFDKNLEDLTIYEASLLALIPPAPNHYSPLKNPQVTYKRHSEIILNLVKNGHVNRADAVDGFIQFWTSYLDTLTERSPNEIARSNNSDLAPYVTEHIRELLIDKYGKEKVYKGGLKVYTTIDLRMQDIARKHLVERIAYQQKIAGPYNRRLLSNRITTPTVSELPYAKQRLAGAVLRNVEGELIDTLKWFHFL